MEAVNLGLIIVLGTGSFWGIISRDSHQEAMQKKEAQIEQLRAEIKGLTVGCLGGK